MRVAFHKAKWIDKVCGAVSAPLLRTPGLFAFMVISAVTIYDYCYLWGPSAMPYTSYGATFVTGILICNFLFCLLEAWIALLIYDLLLRWKRWVSIVWLSVVWIIWGVSWLVDVGALIFYGTGITEDFYFVLQATNGEEAFGFLKTYLTWRVAGIMALFITPAVICGFFFSRFGKFLRRRLGPEDQNKYIRFCRGICAGLLLVIAALVVKGDSEFFLPTPIGKIYMFLTVESASDLEPQNPTVTPTGYSQPQKIVVIIGESHARSHSSLYGYNKSTQPRLERLRADSMLYVVPDPIAPDCHTLGSFKQLIGTYGCVGSDPCLEWYRNVTFMEVAQKAGYRVSWISNQSPKGMWNNPIKRIADMADREIFTTDGNQGWYTLNCDEDLLPLIRKWKDDKRDLSVVHLMGSHTHYADRYPADRTCFEAEDYSAYPEPQRYWRATYDNTIRYNDYIVSQIMKLYRREDAVVIYLSDHGEDIYDSSTDFIGHGLSNNPKSYGATVKIPMYIYLSARFKKLHPHQTQIVKELAESPEPYYTTDLIYLLADFMAVKFEVPEHKTNED